MIDDLLGDDPADLDGDPDPASELWASRTLQGRTEVTGSLDADHIEHWGADRGPTETWNLTSPQYNLSPHSDLRRYNLTGK